MGRPRPAETYIRANDDYGYLKDVPEMTTEEMEILRIAQNDVAAGNLANEIIRERAKAVLAARRRAMVDS
jgi:hypothetical protein